MEQENRRTRMSASLTNYPLVSVHVIAERTGRPSEETVHAVGERNLSGKLLGNSCDGSVPEHCHLFLNGLQTGSPSDLMAKLKRVTSRKLRT
jgi:putative transposase